MSPRELFVTVNELGTILSFSPSCEEATGYSRDEVIGRNLLEMLVPVEWHPIILKRIAALMGDGVQLPQVNPWRTKNGELIDIEWHCTMVPSGGGGRCVVGVGRLLPKAANTPILSGSPA